MSDHSDLIARLEKGPDGLGAACPQCKEAATALRELSKDVARWRWLSEHLSHQRGSGPTEGWGTDVLYPGDDPESAIDAAMANQP